MYVMFSILNKCYFTLYQYFGLSVILLLETILRYTIKLVLWTESYFAIRYKFDILT